MPRQSRRAGGSARQNGKWRRGANTIFVAPFSPHATARRSRAVGAKGEHERGHARHDIVVLAVLRNICRTRQLGGAAERRVSNRGFNCLDNDERTRTRRERTKLSRDEALLTRSASRAQPYRSASYVPPSQDVITSLTRFFPNPFPFPFLLLFIVVLPNHSSWSLSADLSTFRPNRHGVQTSTPGIIIVGCRWSRCSSPSCCRLVEVGLVGLGVVGVVAHRTPSLTAM